MSRYELSGDHENVMRSGAMAGRVLRYHTWPVLHRQSVGEHSHRVITLYLRVYGLPRAEVLAYIAQHDLGELNSGDTPHYAKRQVPGLGEAVNEAESIGRQKLALVEYALSVEENLRVKTCDLLEMFEFGLIESKMGNTYGTIVCDNVKRALINLIGKNSAAELMFMIIANDPGIPATEKERL